EGVRWFLERVWSEGIAQHTSLCLAGRGSLEALERLGQFQNVSALGEREDLHVEIARSACAVVPILHGSGTRLKCVEALALRTPLVSTRFGAQGLDCAGAIAIADSPEEFRSQLLRVLHDGVYRDTLIDGGYRLFEREYSLLPNVRRLQNVLSAARQTFERRIP